MKKITAIVLVLLFGITASHKGYAQDIHFSQFYHSPLTLNPALAGYFDGQYRLAGNYRHQWADIGGGNAKIPFITYGASYDMTIPVSLPTNGEIGGGLQFFNDQSGSVGLNNRSVLLAGTYRHPFGDKGRHTLSVGLQGGIVNKSIDLSKIVFGSQMKQSGSGIVTDPQSGEPIANDAITYFDLRAGAFWNSIINESWEVNGGFSVFHLTQPKENFTGAVEQGAERLNMRYVAHGSGRYNLNERIDILPGLLIMNQSKAQEINWGSLATYRLEREKNGFNGTLFGGLWFRMSAFNQIVDAVIPTVGIQRNAVKVGLSYDVNVSSLREASAYRGGPEISIIYIPQPYEPKVEKREVPCIRF